MQALVRRRPASLTKRVVGSRASRGDLARKFSTAEAEPSHSQAYEDDLLPDEDSIVVPVTYKSKPVIYSRLTEIKQERIGRELEHFKNLYEQPVASLYASVKAKLSDPGKIMKLKMKLNETKFLLNQNREASEEERRERDATLQRLQNLVSAKLQEDPVTLSDFVEGTDPRVSSLSERMEDLVKFHFPSSELAPISKDREFLDPDEGYQIEPHHLTAETAWDDTWKYPESHRSYMWQHVAPPVEHARYVAWELDKIHGFKNVDHKHPILNVDDAKRRGLYKYVKKHVMIWNPTNARKRWAEKQEKRAALIAEGIDPDAHIPKPDVASDSPAVIAYLEKPLKKKTPKPKIRRGIPTDEQPFALTTVQIPNQYTRDERIKLMTRKVILKIKVSALNLPEVVEQRLKELAGLRYDANTGCVRLIADQKLRRGENKAHVLGLAKTLLSEAWRADLNYIPSALEPVMPTQRLDREIYTEKAKQQRADAVALQSFLNDKRFTTFKFPHSLPIYDVTQRRARAAQLLGELQAL